MQQSLDLFRRHLLARGHSPRTTDAYACNVARVAAVLAGALGRAVVPDDLTGAAAQAWLDAAPLCVRTRRCYLTSLRAWFRWRRRTGQAAADDGRDLEAPRDRSYRLPRVLTREEVDRLVEAPIRLGSRYPRVDVRDAAFLELLYSTGLRVSEACSLELHSLRFCRGYASGRVVGKGNKERPVILLGAALVALRRYLAQRPAWPGAGSAALFLGLNGRRLSRRAAGELVRRWGHRTGLRAWPHLLRHCYATDMVAACGEAIRGVQELMGHVDPRTTSMYAQIDEARLLLTARRHPRARRAAPPVRSRR